MDTSMNRRDVLKLAAATGLVAMPGGGSEFAFATSPPGWISGRMTGARALVEALQAEGTCCVFGIPGAQENELWDQFKSSGLPYLLVTHEFSASCAADGAARVTGKPGVLCVVPGPGITNALTGIGEALLDSIPLVCIVGDVARGAKYRPFQVHDLPAVPLLRPVCKSVIEVCRATDIPNAVRLAFQQACAGEPGPVAVVVPYNLLMESHHFDSGPLAPCGVPFDDCAFELAVALLGNRRLRVGIYAGLGCMDHSPALTRVAEIMQAPVATSVSGKGVIDECHALAVGWGYGPQGTRAAERAFRDVDLLLAIGVRFSEVSTGFYSVPQPKQMIHVDANNQNLGRILRSDVCVHADAGVFLHRLIERCEQVSRPPCAPLINRLRRYKEDDAAEYARCYARHGIDPMALILALRRAMSADGVLFVDVTMTEHWAAEGFRVQRARTYFNPTDNQSMGWSIPAAIGAQRVLCDRQVVALVGDGCFLMSAMELSTAAREGLPVKYFVLDDQAYRYMQALQRQAYRRTTATVLARLDYPSLAKGLGVTHVEICSGDDLEAQIRGILALPGPVLTTVHTDHGRRPVRWIDAVRGRFTQELSTQQKVRFAARLGARTLTLRQQQDD